MEKIIDIIKDNKAVLQYASAGVLYYKIETNKSVYIFPVDMNDREDVGTARFEAEHKAVTLMRYLNKAIQSNSLFTYTKKED